MTETSATVGRNVRARRGTLGMSAAAVAEAVTQQGAPLSRSALSQVENGKRRVTVDELVALAAALYVKPKRLLKASA